MWWENLEVDGIVPQLLEKPIQTAKEIVMTSQPHAEEDEHT